MKEVREVRCVVVEEVGRLTVCPYTCHCTPGQAQSVEEEKKKRSESG